MSENEIQPLSQVSNPFEMTAQECADWLARNKGYEFKYNSWWHPDFPAMFHPYPLTIDSAARAMSDQYNVRIEYQKARKQPWLLNFWKSGEAFPKITRVTALDEITVRMRAAVLTRFSGNQQ